MRLRQLPGVVAAAQADIVPMSGSGWNQTVLVDGSRAEGLSAEFNRVSPGYFKTMGTPLVSGRDFDERDDRLVRAGRRSSTRPSRARTSAAATRSARRSRSRSRPARRGRSTRSWAW